MQPYALVTQMLFCSLTVSKDIAFPMVSKNFPLDERVVFRLKAERIVKDMQSEFHTLPRGQRRVLDVDRGVARIEKKRVGPDHDLARLGLEDIRCYPDR